MNRALKYSLALVVFGAVVALVAWPVYAHCGKCAVDCKTMVKAMDEGKLTLAKAIEKAEAKSKGRAVGALCELEEGKLDIEVWCLVGDKIMEVTVDGKTGEATDTEEVKALLGEEEKEGDKDDDEKEEKAKSAAPAAAPAAVKEKEVKK